MRMGMCRFTRVTAVSLHFVYYNFARPHQTLTRDERAGKTTPAMAAGKANRVWMLTDIDGLLAGTLPSS